MVWAPRGGTAPTRDGREVRLMPPALALAEPPASDIVMSGQGRLELKNFPANLELYIYRVFLIFKAILSFGKMRRYIYKTTRR